LYLWLLITKFPAVKALRKNSCKLQERQSKERLHYHRRRHVLIFSKKECSCRLHWMKHYGRLQRPWQISLPVEIGQAATSNERMLPKIALDTSDRKVLRLLLLMEGGS
jgi:hypothetical protein